MYSYSHSAVRLKIPSLWFTRLVLRPRRYLTREAPLVIISLLLLLLVLSKRQYRTFFSWPSIWRSLFYLVSGLDERSLFRTSQQGIVMLLTGGIISLVLRYPISLLKESAISTALSHGGQPPGGFVRHCHFVRETLDDFKTDLKLRKLENEESLRTAARANLHNGYPNTSWSTVGMTRSTKLAVLVQYSTLCDDAELIKLHVAHLSSELLIKFETSSRGAQTMCTKESSAGAQTLFGKLSLTSTQILEHDLLRHHHVKSSLYLRNRNQVLFWAGDLGQRNSECAARYGEVINDSVAAFAESYSRFNVFGDEAHFVPPGIANLKYPLTICLGIPLTFAASYVMSSFIFRVCKNVC